MKKQGEHRVCTLSPQCESVPYSHTMLMSLTRKRGTNYVLGGVDPVSWHLTCKLELFSKMRDQVSRRDQVTSLVGALQPDDWGVRFTSQIEVKKGSTGDCSSVLWMNTSPGSPCRALCKAHVSSWAPTQTSEILSSLSWGSSCEFN